MAAKYFMKHYFRPEVVPVCAAVTAGLSFMVYSGWRSLMSNPDVRPMKLDREEEYPATRVVEKAELYRHHHAIRNASEHNPTMIFDKINTALTGNNPIKPH
eukprot:jgi/Mesvir1/16869/Mv15753-RA.1